MKENILTIKYVKTRAHIPTVKAQHISDDTKEVINDLINDKFGNHLFQKLTDTDRRLVKRVIKAFKLTVGSAYLLVLSISTFPAGFYLSVLSYKLQ